MSKLKIVYGGGHQPVFDNALKEFMESRGYKWTGSGMLLKTQERDICFEK